MSSCTFSNVAILKDKGTYFPPINLQQTFPSLLCVNPDYGYLSRIFDGVKVLWVNVFADADDDDDDDLLPDIENIPDIEKLVLNVVGLSNITYEPLVKTEQEAKKFIDEHFAEIINNFVDALLPKKISIQYVPA